MRVEIDGRHYVPAPTDNDSVELNQLRQEREDVIKMLRYELKVRGDNDWPDSLHLCDILEKHLFDHKPAEVSSAELDRLIRIEEAAREFAECEDVYIDGDSRNTWPELKRALGME